MRDLVRCVSCDRHIRPAEDRCPFCGSPASNDARAPNPPAAPPGLSRARLYAFHAAVATGVAAAACGGQTTASSDAGNAGDVLSSDATGGQDAAPEAASVVDSSSPGDGGVDGAVVDSGWGVIPPPYGCVFPEGCGEVKV